MASKRSKNAENSKKRKQALDVPEGQRPGALEMGPPAHVVPPFTVRVNSCTGFDWFAGSATRPQQTSGLTASMNWTSYPGVTFETWETHCALTIHANKKNVHVSKNDFIEVFD